MRILLFGGTFDPPHNGHVSLLRACIGAASPSQVVVMPAGAPPHKTFYGTPAPLRVQMCEAAFTPCFENLTVSELEIKRAGKSYTADTVESLLEDNPGAQLFLCVGGDMLASFTKWNRYEQLLQRVTLVAHPREAGEQEAFCAAVVALQAQGGRVLVCEGPLVQISSTQVRAARARGNSLKGLVPPAVLEIITKNNLYE
ncbi:nicotinate (nicotinamide) nucleotide adenylyltransferase [Ruminococcaceae bacterium OttesenSCG-928-N02]|nr:nicotinate (nicotinamide) nucleotide adenylyltransferase [Ruminococcaceae bacterium OttesenSCG-928-N02]